MGLQFGIEYRGEFKTHIINNDQAAYDIRLVDMDQDGDVDFVATRGNSAPYDGVFWLEQVRSSEPLPSFERARIDDSREAPLPVEVR